MVKWADQHEKGKAAEILVIDAMTARKAAAKMMIMATQKW